jgi:hypothetical protein
MFGRVRKLQAELAAVEAENDNLRARVAEVERDYRGCIEYRQKLLAQRERSLAIRLPGDVHDLYRQLAAAARDSCSPQSPSDPIVPREDSDRRIRGLLRLLKDSGEVVP